VSYESYDENWKVIKRDTKTLNCYKNILELINKDKINKEKYSYLIPYMNYIRDPKNEIDSIDKKIQFLHKNFPKPYKALIKIKN